MGVLLNLSALSRYAFESAVGVSLLGSIYSVEKGQDVCSPYMWHVVLFRLKWCGVGARLHPPDRESDVMLRVCRESRK